MPSNHTALDTRIHIITPENIAFHHRVAGPFQRLPAWLFDSVLRGLALFIMAICLLMTLGAVGGLGFGIGMWMVAWFILDWAYSAAFESLWNGQTPGKRVFRLRVLTVEGRPIRAWQAILRNVLRAADCLPFLDAARTPTYLLGLLSASSTERFQRLGDLACGTMVVVEDTLGAHGVRQINDQAVVQLARRLPLNFRMSRSLGRALAMYVSRRQRFGFRRRAEMAQHLAGPLREKLNLEPDAPPDLLLCALYYRAFIGEPVDAEIAPPKPPLPQLNELPSLEPASEQWPLSLT